MVCKGVSRKCCTTMTAATKSKALVPSVGDPLERRDRKPTLSDRRGSHAQEVRVGWGRGGEPGQDALLCFLVLGFAPHGTTCRSGAPEVPSCCREPASPNPETMAEGLAIPRGS